MSGISYISTRGLAPELDLRGVTLAGLAPDGGLYVPKTWPRFSAKEISALSGKSYADVAETVLAPFVGDSLPSDVMKKLVRESYATFSLPAVAPLVQIDERLWVLELFHGPTLAFKDIALQLLGRMFDYFLGQSGERMTVIGATSGDTGPAAMTALAGRRNVDVFILYPQKGPTDIQRRQMTCLEAENVHALAIDGDFDACQAIVKAMLNDPGLRAKHRFAAINSINWMRLLAQMVYYFAAAAKLGPKAPSFVVPSGNFGNVYAGYAASKCGLPVAKLAVASNRNDTLTRFFTSGRMKPETTHLTLSPSMDIQVGSNFERLLFDLCGRESTRLRFYMDRLANDGGFTVTPSELGQARLLFTAARVDDDMTLVAMRSCYETTGYMLDPHTAVAVDAARQLVRELPDPVVCLATAHPAKFSETMRKAIGKPAPMPDAVAGLMQKPERVTHLPADMQAVAAFVAERVRT